jgi:hypothetical protein
MSGALVVTVRAGGPPAGLNPFESRALPAGGRSVAGESGRSPVRAGSAPGGRERRLSRGFAPERVLGFRSRGAPGRAHSRSCPSRGARRWPLLQSAGLQSPWRARFRTLLCPWPKRPGACLTGLRPGQGSRASLTSLSTDWGLWLCPRCGPRRRVLCVGVHASTSCPRGSSVACAGSSLQCLRIGRAAGSGLSRPGLLAPPGGRFGFSKSGRRACRRGRPSVLSAPRRAARRASTCPWSARLAARQVRCSSCPAEGPLASLFTAASLFHAPVKHPSYTKHVTKRNAPRDYAKRLAFL